jgi:hypothetical protein
MCKLFVDICRSFCNQQPIFDHCIIMTKKVKICATEAKVFVKIVSLHTPEFRLCPV